MKKRFFAGLTVMLIILPIFFVKAEAQHDGSVYRFNDYCEFVSEEENRELNERIDQSIEELKMDFPIFVLDEYTGDTELSEYAETVYEKNKFGYGEEKSGIFLIVNTDGNDCGLFFYGTAEKDIPRLKRESFTGLAEEIFNNEALSRYDMAKSYLDAVFALTAEWHIDKADKEDGMPYWYADDVEGFQNYHAEDSPRVVDNAGIFTREEQTELEEQVKRICDNYDLSYVIFTDDSSYGLSKEVYSADFLYYGGYGRGDDFDAVCFFLCLEDGNRGWRTTSIGRCQDVFTKDVTYMIDETVDSDMRAGNYYTAIKKQADFIEKNLERGKEKGKNIYETEFRLKSKLRVFLGWPLIVGIIISLVIMGMTVEDMKQKMRVSTAVKADEYLENGSLKIRNKNVRLIYTTVTRRAKPEKSSGGGSSYSSGHSSSGGSYSSGGRDF